MTTLALLVLLGLLLAPARAQSRTGGSNLACLANLRRLVQAWQMYADDQAGRLPLNGDTAPTWVYGFLDYSPANRVNTDLAALLAPSVSSLGPYTRDASLYRCPADASMVRSNGLLVSRVRSYSMNGALGVTSSFFLPAPPYRLYLRQSDLVNPPPAQHWVFIDEHPDSINDGNFIVTISSSPSQTRIVDYPAAWHDRGAGLAFADGRAEIHRWLDARTMPAPRYDGSLALNVASPNNPDVAWLAARTSARAP